MSVDTETFKPEGEANAHVLKKNRVVCREIKKKQKEFDFTDF
jgi:hypothetical protein